ncbi:MAG: ABC transporter substrate-binding protein [Rhodobacteraceae bacterium]|nr:ABC transporter substrate-binding protein [Paracoccaceae bacterium]
MVSNLSRRNVLKSGAATVAAGAVWGLPTPGFSMAKSGGMLRVGVSGANTSDSWDGRTHSDLYMQLAGHGTVFECLTEINADGDLVGELAESWEGSDDAVVWTVNLKKGVTFHNGKSFGADDVIESLGIHVAEGAKSAAQPIVANIAKMEKTGEHQVQLTLKAGNADFPFLLSDYHILMYPAGMIEQAIADGIGTGPYRVESFDPGVRLVCSKVAGHHREGMGGWFDGVEVIAINDVSARMNALMTGQVDVVSHVDFKIETLLKANPNVEIFEVTGNQHYTFPMLTNVAPFDDVNVRKALKYAVRRQEMVDKILQGHGAIGNDSPIGPGNRYFAADLPQLEYDPDKAKHHLKLAGLDSLTIDLSTSEAAFVGATDAAQLYQASAAGAGVNINVVQEAADGYWSNVWLKKPWCACFWGGRATEDWMFSTAYELGVPWNDTHWNNARFQELLVQGRTTIDDAKRRAIYTEMQALISAEGGTVIPMFANYVGAASKALAHGKIGNAWAMDSARITKRWWFA